MPIRYAVENTGEESVVIDGLGVIPPKTEMSLDDKAVKAFEWVRGLKLTNARMPVDVVLSVEVTTPASDE